MAFITSSEFVQVLLNFFFKSVFFWSFFFSHITRQTQFEHPLAARYGQHYLLNSSTKSQVSHPATSQASSITFQQHQQHIYANAANLQGNQLKLSLERLTLRDNSDNHVYSNVPLSFQKSSKDQLKLAGQSNLSLTQSNSLSKISENGASLPQSTVNAQSDGNNNMNQRPLPSLPLPPRPARVQNCIVPANPYLTEEIPDWLFVYSKAPPEYDHKLKVKQIVYLISPTNWQI